MKFFVAILTPPDPRNQKRFNISNWESRGIAWTMVPLTNRRDGSRWRSIDHFSMLSYGSIPDDGIEFFTQFILDIKQRWLKLCYLAEGHLSKRVSWAELIAPGYRLILFDLLLT
jgi:hypothetical protein